MVAILRLSKTIVFSASLVVVAGLFVTRDYISLPLELFFAKRLHKRIESALTPRHKTVALYRLMEEVHRLFELRGIMYWIDGGTLLGAIRNKGIIPTDDDLDICVFAKDEPKIEALAPLLEKRGLKLTYLKEARFFKIVSKENPNVWVDIFFVRSMGKKEAIQYADKWHRTAYPHCFNEKKDLWPLKLLPFGPIQVWSPANPLPYLDRAYGPMWKSVAYISKHKDEAGPPRPLRFSVPLAWSQVLRDPAPWSLKKAEKGVTGTPPR